MADVMSNLRVRVEGARLIGLAAMNEGDAREIPIPNSKADIGTVAASLPDHNSLQGPAVLRGCAP
jgi:hypothetical protein